MSSEIWDGLILIVIGMLVVFVGLSVLVIAIMIMNRLFPDKDKKTEEPSVAGETVSEQSEKEKVAALAVALAVAMEQNKMTPEEQIWFGVEASSAGASRWAVAGRERAMHSREKAGRYWGRRSG